MRDWSKRSHRIILPLLLGLLALSISACAARTEIQPTPPKKPDTGLVSQLNPTNISANGVVLPYRQVKMGFGVGGYIESIPAEIGENVQAGAILVILDSYEAKLVVQQAQTDLESAQANYDLAAASLPAEQQAAISAASLELITTQQTLDEKYQNVELAAAQALQAVTAAEKEVADAQNHHSGLQMNANQAYIDAAHANMILAKAQLEKAQEAFEPWKNKREDSVNRATFQSKFAEAQQLYDAAVRRYNGLFGVTDGLNLAQAEADMVLARATLANAQQTYERLKDGPDPDQVAFAEARVANAQAQLDMAMSANPTAEKLSLARAEVDSARLNLELAQAQLDKMTLTAPFDGVISAIELHEGEWAVPGVAVIELLDTSAWMIETKNVGELQIGRVEIGQVVLIRVNAFQGETLDGRVVAISPDAVVQQGDTTYTLLIELDPTELNLRPGMTARVEILLE